MKISVIIPAYNAEKYIERSIISALNQKHKPFEIIVVDDGSTDNTARITKKFSLQVRYIFKNNGGVSSARNLGIKTAKGDWIALLDSDDEWMNYHLEDFNKILNKNEDIKWYGAPENLLEEITERELFKYKEPQLNFDNQNTFFDDYLCAVPPLGFFATSTMIIKKEIFELTGLFDSEMKIGEDIDLWFRIGLLFPKVGYSFKVAAIKYERLTSLSHSTQWKPMASLHRISKSEKQARKLGSKYLHRAEPRIIYWVIKILKASILRQDEKTLKEIKRRYFFRLSIKYKAILILTTKAPITLKIINKVKS